MERKITKIGNSHGVTFPKKLLDEFEWNDGDTVKIEMDKEKIILRKVNKIELPLGVNREVFEEFMKNYNKEESGTDK